MVYIYLTLFIERCIVLVNMGVQDAQNMAQALLREHKLDAWSFKFDGATRRFGYCDYRNRVISVSKPLSKLNTEERVKNTILHEIAHVLTPGANHTLRWKLAALKIGCDGEARYNGKAVVLPPTKFRYKYEAVCEKCG